MTAIAHGEISVLLLTRYERNGASSRVRCLNYLSFLEQSGIKVTIAPFFGFDYLTKLHHGLRYQRRNLIRDYAMRLQNLMSASRYDLIWIEKEVLPWLPAWLEGVFLRGLPFIVDYDDYWSARYTDHRNFMIRLLMPRKLESIVLRASAVVVGNPFLANWAKEAGARRVVELPTVVDPAHYAIEPFPDGPFTLGWIGSPLTEDYVRLIAGPLRHMQEKYGARLRMIGARESFSLPGVAIDHIPWREETEGDELARCHVGIMPLADGAWEQGKCGYKLIQYMACGRPAVGTSIGVNKSIVVNGLTGFLVHNDHDWIGALSALALDAEMRRRFGVAGRQRVIRNYSHEAVAPKLRELLFEVARSGSPAKGNTDKVAGVPALNRAG